MVVAAIGSKQNRGRNIGVPTRWSLHPCRLANSRLTGVLVALLPVHDVELVPRAEDDRSVPYLFGAHLCDLVGRRFTFSQVKLESPVFHENSIAVSKLRQACRRALHILRHPQR